MHSRPSIARRLSLALASLIILLVNTVAFGQGMSYEASFKVNKEPIPVNVLVGQSRVINFDKPVGRFSVSNPEIAEAVLVTPDQVLVNGKGFGQVNFIAWEQSGSEYLVFDVLRTRESFVDRFANARPVSEGRHSSEPGKRLGGDVRQRLRSEDGGAGTERSGSCRL